MEEQQPVLIELGATVPWVVTRYSDCFVGHCDALRLTAEADTEEELNEMIAEILDDLFRHLIQEGKLNAFLCSMGWIHHATVNHYGPIEEDTPLKIPWEIISQRQAQQPNVHY
jgi:predicted RNase H-like HicB family nuclease